MIQKITAWFDAQHRQAIYAAVAALAPILVTLGVITDGQTEAVLVIGSAALQAFAGILALVNLTPRAAGEWFVTAGRGAIYALAAGVAPAAVALGWLTDAAAVNVLTGVSRGLTALAALIGIIFITPDHVRELKRLPYE